jgi:hypothetical protein
LKLVYHKYTCGFYYLVVQSTICFVSSYTSQILRSAMIVYANGSMPRARPFRVCSCSLRQEKVVISDRSRGQGNTVTLRRCPVRVPRETRGSFINVAV